MGQLKDDVLEVIRKFLAHQALDVLEHEGLRPQLAHGADRLGKHVSLVHETGVFATHGKRLAGRPARDHQHIVEASVAELANIALVQRPFLNRSCVPALILAEGFAGVVIPFHDRSVMKAGVGHANGEAARAREKLNSASKNLLIAAASAAMSLSWHSQIVSTPQSSSASNRLLRSSRAVTLKLRQPEIKAGLRQPRKGATGVPMPVATVNENNLASLSKDQVRPTGQIALVKPIAIAESEDKFSNSHFRPRVLGTDARHDL